MEDANMQALVMMAGLILAVVGQGLNSNPKIPSSVVKLSMAVTGVLLYLIVATPAAWTHEAFLAWLDQAVIWAAAIPGFASLVGIIAPGMKTNDNPQGGVQ